jgi:hypothetical protein
MILYTVDRTSKLAENMQIALTRYNDVSPQELQLHVDELFPEGFSVHGERYFLKNSSNSNSINPNIELIFEIVRQAHYEDKPSRFQSFFATETVEDAKKFSSKFGTDNDLVFKIECECYFKADMSLLTLNNTILVESKHMIAILRLTADMRFGLSPSPKLLFPSVRATSHVRKTLSAIVGRGKI